MAKTPLPSYDEALELVLALAPKVDDESIALDDASGRTLRQDIIADRDQPPFNRSAMDGFAVRSGDVIGAHAITGEVPAGRSPEGVDVSGVVRIATGASVPDAFDAVIPIEKAKVDSDRVSFDIAEVQAGQAVHARGSDAQAGDVVVEAGTTLGAQHIGIAAAMGLTRLTVAQRPRIVLLTTGDEVMPAGATLLPHQIRNSNGPMLRAMLAALGAPLLDHVHVPDDLEQTLCAAREALSRAHMVITVGGVSVGQRDFLPMAWQQLGLETVVHGVAIQPGKPVLAARDECKLVIGLPGNPVSVWTTAHLFVAPVVAASLSRKRRQAWREVALKEPAKAKSARQLFRAAKLHDDGSASLVAWHGSGDLMHTAGGDGFVRLPLVDGEVAPGTRVPFMHWTGA